ncbi:hypothetical protein DSM104635_00152 [Terricaulis silvestris]|uniref:Uncharacterized protein n=1 Tax=Terricaulis silvestris TaxID=2686094 RepID=A0A6I6MP60_9CAUL|nr:hypothetical protein DSM104635_00152 [Terricaulis silvestris]
MARRWPDRDIEARTTDTLVARMMRMSDDKKNPLWWTVAFWLAVVVLIVCAGAVVFAFLIGGVW